MFINGDITNQPISKAKRPHHRERVLYAGIPSVRVAPTNMDSPLMQSASPFILAYGN